MGVPDEHGSGDESGTGAEPTRAEFGREEVTVPDSGSVLGEALRDVAFSLNEVVRDCAESAHVIPRLQGDARVVAVLGLAKKMGELGDIAHETRQSLESLAADTFLLSRL